jgi:hypothetical protein
MTQLAFHPVETEGRREGGRGTRCSNERINHHFVSAISHPSTPLDYPIECIPALCEAGGARLGTESLDFLPWCFAGW